MGTTWAEIPIAFRSACTSVAIWLRCTLLEVTTMLNSTGWPLESSSMFSAFQEKPGGIPLQRGGFPLRFQRGVIISAQAADDLRIARLKADHLRILRRDHNEHK